MFKEMLNKLLNKEKKFDFSRDYNEGKKAALMVMSLLDRRNPEFVIFLTKEVNRNMNISSKYGRGYYNVLSKFLLKLDYKPIFKEKGRLSVDSVPFSSKKGVKVQNCIRTNLRSLK